MSESDHAGGGAGFGRVDRRARADHALARSMGAAHSRAVSEAAERRARRGVHRFTHLFALSAFAFAAPLFAKLGPAPGYFAAHGLTSLEVVMFAVALAALPALVLIVFEWITGIAGRRVRWIVHLILVALLVGLIFLPPLGALSSVAAYGVALVIGIAFAALYARFRGVRTFTSLLGFAPIAFVLWFLLLSPTSEMVTGSQLDAWRADDSFRPPIVFIQFDALPSLLLETPRHEVDAVRFPNFAKLSRDGVWYRNASNVHENTVFSVPSFLDGKLPHTGIKPVAQDHSPNLFTVLGNTYRMNVSEEATTLCPYQFCRRRSDDYGNFWDDTRVVFNQIIRPEAERDSLPSITHRWRSFDEGPVKSSFRTRKKTPAYVIRHLHAGRIGRFDRWLGKVGHGGALPELDYIHMFLPHEPREYIPDGRHYVTPDPALEGPPAYDNRFLSEQEEQRTILQLGYTDRVVGQVIAKLRRLGIYDEAYIVVVADHGESFLPPKATPAGPFVPGHLGYRRAVTHRNVEDIASIPLFIKYPKDEGPATRRDDRFVRSVDTFPTLVTPLDVQLPRIAGRDLQSTHYRGHDQVRVAKTFGGTIRMSVSGWQRARSRSLQRRLALFGSGRQSVYDSGPHRDLIGRPITDFETVQTTVPRATFVNPKQFENVNPVAPICLCQIAGRIEGTTAPGAVPAPITTPSTGGVQATPPPTNVNGMPLALAVNGRIAATAEGFSSRGAKKLNWAAMIPPSAYKDGRNAIDVYEILGARRLAKIGSAP